VSSPSRTKAVAAAAAATSLMARMESNDGNDVTVRHDRGDDGRGARGAVSSPHPSSYASSSSALSETTTTLKREWYLADAKDTKKRLIKTSECARSYTLRALIPRAVSLSPEDNPQSAQRPGPIISVHQSG
jgi:hypothetical protein